MDNITGRQLINVARKYLGIPFYHTGRNNNGVDCCGLIICTLHDLGLYLDWDDRNYSYPVRDGRMKECILKFCYEIPIDSQLLTADIILMKVARQQHIALYTENNCMIHAYQSAGCVAEHEITKQWSDRIIGKFRLKDLY